MIDCLLLQINDGAFPIGSYTQSYGLETYTQKGIVHDEHTAYAYIKSMLQGNFFYNELLSCFCCYKHTKNGEMDKIHNINALLEATRTPKEIRLASEKLATRFIKTINGMGLEENIFFKRYCEQVQGNASHYCAAYGVLCASLSIDAESMLMAYAYSATAAMVTNCVKMVPLSQIVGQKMLFKCCRVFPDMLKKLYETHEECIGLSTPAFDIRGMQHETLYSRLYMS